MFVIRETNRRRDQAARGTPLHCFHLAKLADRGPRHNDGVSLLTTRQVTTMLETRMVAFADGMEVIGHDMYHGLALSEVDAA